MNYLFLLNQVKAESFLNENSNKIFGDNYLIKIKKIKRDKTYNTEGSLNILYNLVVDDKKRSIRVSTSTFLNKEHDYNIMKFFHLNSFNQKPFFTPEPIAYLQNEKILFYENVQGKILADILNDEDTNLDKIFNQCAKLINKVHLLPLPNLPLFNPQYLFEDFKYELITKKIPQAKNLNLVIKKIKDSLLINKAKCFCHGDFNPNNLLILADSICLIDFGITTIFYKEIDLASFLVHLKLLLQKHPSRFNKYRKIFLDAYGDFDKQKLYLLIALIESRLLEISIIFEDTKYDTNFIFECLNDDLKSANIGLENES